MEQINYNRRHDIKINSLQTREINLLLSFVWYESINGEVWKVLFGKLNEPTFFKLNALVFETIYTDIRNPCTRFCILF